MTIIAKAKKKADFDPGVSGKDRVTDTSDGIRFEVRQGEFTGADAPTRNRAELVLSNKSPSPKRHWATEGDEWWYRYDFLIPSSSPMPRDGKAEYQSLMQTIDSSDAGTGHGGLEFRDTKALNPALGGPGYVELLYTDTDSRADGIRYYWRKKATEVTRDKLHTVIIHKRWSADEAKGFVSIAFDGVQQKLTDGTTSMRSKTLGPGPAAWLKIGAYRSDAIGGTFVMLTKGIDVATTRAEVDAGAPPPTPPTPTPVPAKYTFTCSKCGQRYQSID